MGVLLVVGCHLRLVLLAQLLHLLLVGHPHELHFLPEGLYFLAGLEVFLGRGLLWLVFEEREVLLEFASGEGVGLDGGEGHPCLHLLQPPTVLLLNLLY